MDVPDRHLQGHLRRVRGINQFKPVQNRFKTFFRINFQTNTKVNGIPAKRFVVPARALQANTKFNYGFCKESQGYFIDWDACAKEDPDDDELLDWSDCNYGKYR